MRQYLRTIIVTFALLIAIVIPISLIIQTLFKITQIRLIGNAEKDPRLGKEFNSAAKRVIPFIILNIVLFLLEIGGFFLLVIPGLVFAFLLGPSVIEISIYKSKIKRALKNSYRVTTQNFFPFLFRGIILIGTFIGIYLAFFVAKVSLGALGGLINEDLGNILPAIVQIFQSLSGIIITWFSTCYGITLYKQAREVTNLDKKPNFGWLIGVAALGWLLAIFSGILGFTALRKAIKSGIFENMVTPKKEKNIDTDLFKKPSPLPQLEKEPTPVYEITKI